MSARGLSADSSDRAYPPRDDVPGPRLHRNAPSAEPRRLSHTSVMLAAGIFDRRDTVGVHADNGRVDGPVSPFDSPLRRLDAALATLSREGRPELRPSFELGYRTGWLVREHPDVVVEGFIDHVSDRE